MKLIKTNSWLAAKTNNAERKENKDPSAVYMSPPP